MNRMVMNVKLKSIVCVLVLSVSCFLFVSAGYAQDGKTLFQQKCASCHAIDKDLTGPALAGVESRVSDKKLLIKWIQNNQKVLASGDKYFNGLYIKWNKVAMNIFADLSDEQVESILKYVREWKPVAKPIEIEEQGGGSSWFIMLITILLGAGAFGLWRVLKPLKKEALKKEGIVSKPLPFYKDKVNIAIAVLLVVGTMSVGLVQYMIGVGRDINYQPIQPIYYSHKVHAGVNQINCMYCHTSAQQSKFSGIPSVNVCMNCHAAINEYTGEPIISAEGETINGTEEIAKLYAYVGWDSKTKSYTGKGTPIQWTRIHNLPDHVLFNHEQHVVNAQVQCQTCHGPIQEMHEVKQFSQLSMGWCINCHRETKVMFKENAFYSNFEKLHNELKSGKIDSVTAVMIGANECQRCHY